MPNELLRILMMLMKIQDNNVTQAAKNNSEKKEQQMSFSDYREKSVGDAQWAKMTPFPNRRRTPCLSFSSGKAPFHRRTRCQDLLKKALFCWDMGTYTPIAVQQIKFIHMSDLTSVNIIIIIHPGSFLHSLI